jgi:hypothetical protein
MALISKREADWSKPQLKSLALSQLAPQAWPSWRPSHPISVVAELWVPYAASRELASDDPLCPVKVCDKSKGVADYILMHRRTESSMQCLARGVTDQV